MKSNKNKGKLIINNKIFPLKGTIYIKDIKSDEIKVEMLLNKDAFNKSYMFKDCSILHQLKCLNNLYDIDNKIFINKNYSYLRQKEINIFDYIDNDIDFSPIKDIKTTNDYSVYNNGKANIDINYYNSEDASNEIYLNPMQENNGIKLEDFYSNSALDETVYKTKGNESIV